MMLGLERNSPLSNERGQVAVLFAMVFTFMFILFAFVVDFGHLVNNKINLQIAADAAAYAGAAQQARLLNKMGVINYRMRQDLKEFAMRINVTHLRHNRNFPRGPQFVNGGGNLSQTEPFICQQAHGYRAISGLRYAQDTNLCRNASPTTGGLPPIVVPPVIAKFDPFAVAIAAQIRRIQQAANQECRAAAEDNRVLAEYLINAFTARSQFRARQMQALETYMNEMGQEGFATEGSRHPVLKAAWDSAARNLTISNREDNGRFRVEVLQPQGGQYVALEPRNMNGSLFFINFQVEGNGCVGRPSFVDFDNMVAGFQKRDEVLTYFAVKLTARPRLFFMPRPWVQAAFPELVAYAVAKPFGSRIGPDISFDQLVPTPNRPGNQNRMVNFSFRPNDNLGMLNTKVQAYFDALHPYNDVGRPNGDRETGWPRPQADAPGRLALQAIRAPTIFDALFYTVFPDPGPNANTDYLEPQFANVLYPDYVEAANHINDSIIQTPQPRAPAFLPSELGSRNRGNGFIQIDAQGIDGQGPYAGVAAESPSSHSVTSAIGLPAINENTALEFGFATPQMIHSGWAPPGKQPRIGYGVKFVGFDTLRNLRVRNNQSGSRTPIANPPISTSGDPNLNQVLH